MRNLITDVPGLRVGQAEDTILKSGVTVILPDEPAVASVAIHGGAPGTREIALLEPHQTVGAVDALVLSGGSAFGLDAAGAVHTCLAAMGRGFQVGDANVPIVPSAILFDLINGGDKSFIRNPGESGLDNPYRALGKAALEAASDIFELGSHGAGCGATTADLKGGLGSASSRLADGSTVGAIVAVNALGRATMGSSPYFWAAPFELGDEFGGLGLPAPRPADATKIVTKRDQARAGANTTIATVATDVKLTKAEAKRLAVMAQDGLARALWPAHTPMDGDLVFAISTGKREPQEMTSDLIQLGAEAAACLSRAVARAIFCATPAPNDTRPTWREKYANAIRNRH